MTKLPRRLRQLGAVLLARELLQPAGRFVGLVGEIALLLSAASAARLLLPRRGPATLPFGFLFLAPRELLQLLQHLVDLPIGLFGRRLLARLVLVGHLVQFHLEQVGQVLGHLSAATTAAAALLLALDLHLHLVQLFGLLQERQRALLRRQRLLRAGGLKLCLGGLHLRRGLRQQLRDLLECGILSEPFVHAPDETVHLLAQPRFRQRDDRGVLAHLLRARLLAIALDVERRRDDLPLLFGQRAHLVVLLSAAAAALLRRV